jgi:hypothetical protein
MQDDRECAELASTQEDKCMYQMGYIIMGYIIHLSMDQGTVL